MKKLLIISILLITGSSLFAQVGKNLLTPYQSLSYYLTNMTDDNYYPDSAARVFYPRYVGSMNAKSLSVKLKQVLDGKGLYIDMEKVPNDPDFLDSLSKKAHYQLHKDYPLIYLERLSEKWYFSKTTTERINGLHKETFPYGTDRLLNLLPKAGNTKILGIKIWQYAGILIIILISFIFHKVFRGFISNILLRLIRKSDRTSEFISRIKPVTAPTSNAIILSLVNLLIPVLQLPVNLSYYLNLLVAALIPFFVMVAFYRFIDVLDVFFTRLSQKTESTLDDQLVPLIRKSLKAFVIIIGVLVILQNLDVDILPILAGLSVGGIAIALAAQDTVKNLFGSIMIFIDKPFQIGHWITSGDIDGTVEEVGIRSTRVRTFRNSLMYIPNGKLADTMIDNHGLRVYRRFFTKLSITYDTPADLIELFVDGLKKVVQDHPQTRKDYYEIHLNDMGSSSLNVMFYIFFEVPSWSEELKCRHEILLSIIRLAEEIGINFAFPTQTLHIENMPGQLSNSPTYKPMGELKPRMEAFLAGNKQ
jgi:MscS family membrane protein